jgi:quinolinate synthase
MTIQEQITALKKEKNAVILCHSYQPGEVQDIADYVGDSYGLSVEAAETKADVIIFCGVMFMAETAAMLNPTKTVIIPTPEAGCPMADMIEASDVAKLKQKHPNHLVMCYVNSTAEVKALSDVCCTSSNAVKIAQQLPKDKGIIFVPDKHLGSWVQEKTGRKMIIWNGFCPTHHRITADMVREAQAMHPQAKTLIHPEAAKEPRDCADAVLSTGGMIDYVKKSDASEFIIATEEGIIHTLKKAAPGKMFYLVNKAAICPNMKKGSLSATLAALKGTGGAVVTVEKDIAQKARHSLDEMLRLAK